MWKSLAKKMFESLVSVLPITVLVLILSVTAVDISGGTIALFSVGAVFLIVGMGFFTLGADVAMMPMGNSVGSFLSKTKKSKLPVVIIICFVIGALITIAEPDLQVLAEQLNPGSGSNTLLLYSVAVGVGLFLAVSVLKVFFKIKLSHMLLVLYGLVFILAIFVPNNFLAVAFDSGGVTTGPITVPFLMALGIGIASVRGGKSNEDDSFGMIALCSVGPILAVMILGLSGKAQVGISADVIPHVSNLKDILVLVFNGLKHYLVEVAIALLPIIGVFFLFQIFVLKLPKSQIIRIIVGVFYTYIGLTIFLTGVNVGFFPMGKLMGAELAVKPYKYIMIPLGVVMGACIVLAEPAVHVLNKQVEEVTGGAISRKLMMICLCLAIAVSVGLAFLRVLTGLSIWYFIVPVYAISLVLMFFVPQVFTGIAFDSGGVASGPMTATFLLPFAIGACEAIGGNVFMDAFGIVAFVAMTPLITIQLLGLVYKLSSIAREKRKKLALESMEHSNETVDFDTVDTEPKIADEKPKKTGRVAKIVKAIKPKKKTKDKNPNGK